MPLNQNLPPIAKAALRIRIQIEGAVSRFNRSHRYLSGSDLRVAAKDVVVATRRAWTEPAQRLDRVRELAAAIDELKEQLQLSQGVRAFGSFREFEAIAKGVNALGRQCGGWLRQLHSRGQNPPAHGPAERAQTLSSRTAPFAGAQP